MSFILNVAECLHKERKVVPVFQHQKAAIWIKIMGGKGEKDK